MVEIRPEAREDAPAVRRVNEAAFGRAEEADIVERLRDRAASYLALVAVRESEIVGHIAFSRVTLGQPARALSMVGLAPMAVAPDHQRSGVGSALVRAGLAACRAAGVDAVFVLGHPAYYPRFGFEPAVKWGIKDEYGAPDDAFMALELAPGALGAVTGTARYDPALAG